MHHKASYLAILCFYILENVGLDDPNVFEGDMILTPGQRLAAMTGGDVSKAGGEGRASIRKNLWRGGVLIYEIDPALGKQQFLVTNKIIHFK